MRPVRLFSWCLLTFLLVLAGCGSGDDEKPAGGGKDSSSKATEDPASKNMADEDPAAEDPAAEDPAEEADADGLVERTEAGITVKVPATWKLDKDTLGGTLFIWSNPKCKRCGLVALDVQNTAQTADEFVTFQKGVHGSWHNLVKRQSKVMVEGLGQGYRVHVVDTKKNPIDYLVVSAIDGLLVEVTSVLDEDHPEYADLVLSSVKRNL